MKKIALITGGIVINVNSKYFRSLKIEILLRDMSLIHS